MKADTSFQRKDWLAVAILFATSVAMEMPFRTQFAYHWDSAEFVAAIGEYDLRLSQPHWPGYFLYVMLGRVVNFLVGKPHASLVWISVISGAALVAVLYLLGAAMFGRWVGVAAAGVTATSPLVWFHSCVALTYIVDALGVSVLALICFRALQRGGWRETLGIGLVIGIIGGVRPQSLPGVLPLTLYVFWRLREQRIAKLTTAALVALAISAVWFVGMVMMSGGWAGYRAATERMPAFHIGKTLAGGGWDAVGWNIFFIALFCGNGLMAGALVLLAALGYRVAPSRALRIREWDRINHESLRVLWLWGIPFLVLGAFVGGTVTAGHVMSYLPAGFLAVGVVIMQLPSNTLRLWVLGVVCGVNAFAFLVWPPAWDGVFFGTARTAGELRQHDAQLGCTLSAIRAHFDPAEAIVCHVHGHLLYGLRQFELYLPEFDQYRLDSDPAMVAPRTGMLLKARGGRFQFVDAVSFAGTRSVVLVVPPGTRLETFGEFFDVSRAMPVPGSGGILYECAPEASTTWLR
jgi:hypothetical protein